MAAGTRRGCICASWATRRGGAGAGGLLQRVAAARRMRIMPTNAQQANCGGAGGHPALPAGIEVYAQSHALAHVLLEALYARHQ